MISNAYKEQPPIQENLDLEQAAGFSFIRSTLLKVKLLGIAPFSEAISRKNINKTLLVCQCDCGFYCRFNFKKFSHPDFLPACGHCNEQLEQLIQNYFYTHQKILSKQDAWAQLGYVKDKKLTSILFWYTLNRNNHHQIRLGGKDFQQISDQQLKALNAPRYLYFSRACKLAPKQSNPHDPSLIYQCMCGAFAYFTVSFVKQYEPLGMCSMCMEELRYFFNNYTLQPSTPQLEFKHQWKHYLHHQKRPYVEFRYVWEKYFKARKAFRGQYTYELHLKDYIPEYFKMYMSNALP